MGCLGIIGLVVFVALLATYWYVALPVGALLAVGYAYYRYSRRQAFLALPVEEQAAISRWVQNTYKGITLLDGRVESDEGSGPVAGASAHVEAAGGLANRGLLGRKIVDRRELYLVVEGVGFSIVKPLNPARDGASARKFAAKLNAAAAASHPSR